jgi:hypothetical protein
MSKLTESRPPETPEEGEEWLKESLRLKEELHEKMEKLKDAKKLGLIGGNYENKKEGESS